MLAIIQWTLWRRRWFILGWSVGFVAYMALLIFAYPPFRDQAASLNQALEQLPDALKSLASDTNDFLSPIGYMSSNAYYLMIPIMFSIMAIGLGSSLIASDEDEHTLELVLSRPISRGRVLLGRALAGLTIFLITGAITVAATVIFAAIIDLGIGLWSLTVVTLAAMILALMFGALAFALTAVHSSMRAISIGVATLFLTASYLLTSLAGTVEWLKWPAKFLPYNYYHPSDIMNGSYHWRDTLGTVGVIVLLGIIAHIGFRRRDIA